jgi:hypothetical protein
MKDLRNFIKTTIREFILESDNTDFILPKILDVNFFVSLGNPNGFIESKIIGKTSDYYDKTTRLENTEFSTTYLILGNGFKKITIHFPSLELTSNRGGGHSGMGFLFDKDVIINKKLVNSLIPYVEKFRNDNFVKNNGDGGKWRVKTNNPKEIIAYIPK